MVFPMKKLTASAATIQPPPSEEFFDKEVVASDTKTVAAAASPVATAAPSGLDLLFTASQVETTPKAEAEADDEEVPSTITVVSNGGAAEGESGSNSDTEEASHEYNAENSAADALKNQAKSFPQVLHEILATPEYQPIVHWLPDGFSFVIVDKRRFSDVILPKYFREALFHSFIRKLNRWGFRRVKSRGKGEESSFAHNNFVREKPWLCLKMRCKSKPSYHKVPSAKKKTQQTAVEAARSVVNVGHIAIVPAQAPPSFLAAGGMVGMADASRAFVPTCLPVTLAEYKALGVFPKPSLSMATAAGSPSAAIANTIQERQFLTSIRQRQLASIRADPEQQQRLFRERQLIMLQMRQRRQQLQSQLQRLHEISSHNEEQFAHSYFQDSMMAQYARDMLSRNVFYRGEM
jgi:hypothetical protein